MLHPLGAAGGHLAFDQGQGGLEVLSLQAATGIFAQFLYQQPLGLAMLDVVVPPAPPPPISQPQLLPAVGGVNRAAKLLRIHKALHRQDRVPVLRLPIRAESRQSQLEHSGTQIGYRPIREEQKPGVVDHQRQAPPPLLVGPTDPLVAMPQVFGRRAEYQHAHPLPLLIHRNINEPLPHWTQSAQVVMPAK